MADDYPADPNAQQPASTPGFWQGNVLGSLGLRVPQTRQDWTNGLSSFLGGPVDGSAWFLSRVMGIRGLQDPTLGYGEVWRPAPNVPFGSTYWRNFIDDPGITWQQLWLAARRPHGLF